ncbi:hypothetical protein HPB51_008610 [Rhipicephalus microplus]|uniref:Uncharacterized protein n=1 Tax=Rhipicephalus microplus TaxID=6941 RepID=A0A9J6ENI5_RHIMP|nr:hypothetical protein HPB51_008610 [Rhipicephalus microplus]
MDGGTESLDSGVILALPDGPELGVQIRALEGRPPGDKEVRKKPFLKLFLIVADCSLYGWTSRRRLTAHVPAQPLHVRPTSTLAHHGTAHRRRAAGPYGRAPKLGRWDDDETRLLIAYPPLASLRFLLFLITVHSTSASAGEEEKVASSTSRNDEREERRHTLTCSRRFGGGPRRATKNKAKTLTRPFPLASRSR